MTPSMSKEQASVPLCKDCKWSVKVQTYWCENPLASRQSPVDGKYNINCMDARSSVKLWGLCGPEGALFEPKPAAVSMRPRSILQRLFARKEKP